MKTDELIEALGRLKVQTGSLACLGCQHEDNCGVHGCAIMREAVAQLYGMDRIVKHVRRQRNAAVKQLRQIASCETCKHVEQCSEGCEPHNACSMGQNWEWNGDEP